MKQMRAVLVGLGNMGRNHLRVLDKSQDFKICAVVEQNRPDSLPVLSHPVDWFESIDQLDPKDFDCAVVATPTQTHYELVKSLILKGFHVLVEKPAASTYEQATDLAKMASEKGLFLAVGNIERCNPVVAKLKDVLESGAIGTPVHLNATRGGAFPNAVKPGNNVILDLAVHDLDVFRLLLGPLKVDRSVAHSTLQNEILDTAEISVSNQEGITGTVHVNWLSPQKIRQIRVTGSKGVCTVDYIAQTCIVHGKDLDESLLGKAGEFTRSEHKFCEEVHFVVSKGEPLGIQLEQWAKCLAGETHNLAVKDQLTESVFLAETSMSSSDGGLEPMFFEQSTWKPHFSQQPQQGQLN